MIHLQYILIGIIGFIFVCAISIYVVKQIGNSKIMSIDKKNFENYLNEKIKLYQEQTGSLIKSIKAIKGHDEIGREYIVRIKLEIE